MTKRTRWTGTQDIIDPAEWAYVGSFDSSQPRYLITSEFAFDPRTGMSYEVNRTVHDGTHGTECILTSKGEMQDVLATTDASVNMESGQCDHCGAHLRYVVVVKHVPSNDIIAIGEQCMANRFDWSDRASRDVAALRRAADEFRRNEAQRRAADEKRAAFAAAHPTEAAVLAAVSNSPDGRDSYLQKLARDWRQYGDLFEYKVSHVAQCIERETRQQRIADERANEVHSPAPTGRSYVQGEIVHTKLVDGYHEWDPQVMKMLVKDERGFRVWATVPSSAPCVDLRGLNVEFTATLEQSHDDESFAFGKRPSKFKVLTEIPDPHAAD